MTPAEREQLCSFLDQTIEAAQDAGVRLAGIDIDVPHDAWPEVCELLKVNGSVTSCIVGLWQKAVPVQAKKLPAPKKRRTRGAA